ncbi:MAG: hypothetical protein WC378_18310 [Opitutaceae bacterium]|jgi:predicted secreted protein
MTTGAKRAFGVQFIRDTHVIGEVTTVGDLEIELETEDVTSHESAAGYVELIGTILKGGDVKLEGNLLVGDTDGQIGMKADMEAQTLQSFQIVFPNAIATWAFSALVTKWKVPSMPVKGTLKWEAQVTISGQPVLTIGTSTGLTTPFFSVDSGEIVPAAAGATYSYVVVIPTAETDIVITPTASAGVITITANGVSQVVTSGVASSAITLGAAGSVTACTIKVQETNKAAKTYTLQLAREAAA